ncbi:MAG TPA: flagellar hook-associated protein FlgK, partial [bacterium]|nr:flagellar hook-associated protein FlgK [bacterium]
MVFSTWLGLNTASRGLAAAQRGLDTASHNIANANTPGYSRQRANLVASPALHHPSLSALIPGQVGTGVDVASISRIRDTFLDQVYRRQHGQYGEFNSQRLSFSTLETVLHEPSEIGVSSLMDRFFQDWNAVANTPEALPTRGALRETAQTMASNFHRLHGQFVALSEQQNEQIALRVEQVNGILDQIAALNGQIVAIEGIGQQANDLKDRRDLLVDQLSGIVDVTVQEGGQGSADVLLG